MFVCLGTKGVEFMKKDVGTKSFNSQVCQTYKVIQSYLGREKYLNHKNQF